MAEMKDDFPELSWIRVKVIAGDVPKAVRMRHWLKAGLRRWGIRCEVLTGKPPDDGDVDASKAEPPTDGGRGGIFWEARPQEPHG